MIGAGKDNKNMSNFVFVIILVLAIILICWVISMIFSKKFWISVGDHVFNGIAKYISKIVIFIVVFIVIAVLFTLFKK